MNVSTLFRVCNIERLLIVQFGQIICFLFSWLFTHCNLADTLMYNVAILGKHWEQNANRGKNDNLFKDQDPQKPNPIPRHIPV